MTAQLVLVGGESLPVSPDRVSLDPPMGFRESDVYNWKVTAQGYSYQVHAWDFPPDDSALLSSFRKLIPIGYPVYFPPVDPLPANYPGRITPLNGGFVVVSSVDREGDFFKIGLRSLSGSGVMVSGSNPPVLTGAGIGAHTIDPRASVANTNTAQPWKPVLTRFDLGAPYVVTAPRSFDTDGTQQIALPDSLVLPENLKKYPPPPNRAAGTPPDPMILGTGMLRIDSFSGASETGEQPYKFDLRSGGITSTVTIAGETAFELLSGKLSGFVLEPEHMGTARIQIDGEQWAVNQFNRTGEKNYAVVLTRNISDE